MRSPAVVACLAVLAIGWFAVSSNESVGEKTTSTEVQSPLVVHEWGTFTNFSGSDGVQLEFRPLAQRDLPGFVLTYMDQWGLSFRKWQVSAFQRMETPVTYFYTPVERDVRVRVGFPEGLLTEFYPPVDAMTPARPQSQTPVFGSTATSTVDLPLKDSSLEWNNVHLIPIEQLTTQVDDPVLAKSMGRFLAQQLVPDARAFPHYVHARETDSALVNVQFHESRRGALKGDYFEKFLFYRGLGNFELPLTLEALGEGNYRLTNDGQEPIRSLFLVTIDGNTVRFRTYDGIESGDSLTLIEAKQASNVEQLSEAMAAALVAEGLYRKEAEAMVNAWRDSWFAEEGTRLLYMAPRRITDKLLPLEVEPQPDEVVRVLVGRMEIMSPEDEQQILGLVQRSASAREAERSETQNGTSIEANDDRRERAAAFEELLAMGRLAEPALVRARSITGDASARNEAAQLIGELRAHLEKQPSKQ